MTSAIVRISGEAHLTLKRLAQRGGIPMQAVVDRAIELYRRHTFLHQVNAGYQELRSSRRAWKALEQERGAWDLSLWDGLEEPSERPGTAKKRRLSPTSARSASRRGARRG